MKYYDQDGQPMKRLDWLNGDYKIGLTEIGPGRVSTIWLGLDHQWGEGPPLIFETMVFGGPYDEHVARR